MASANSARTAATSVARASFTRRLRSTSRNCVALTPVSAISSASSSSSYSASSIRVPVKTVVRPEPVFFNPVRKRSSQRARLAAVSAATFAGAWSDCGRGAQPLVSAAPRSSAARRWRVGTLWMASVTEAAREPGPGPSPELGGESGPESGLKSGPAPGRLRQAVGRAQVATWKASMALPGPTQSRRLAPPLLAWPNARLHPHLWQPCRAPPGQFLHC